MRRFLAVVIVLGLALPAGAWEVLKTSSGKPLRWQDARMPVPYTLNSEGSTDVEFALVQQAVRTSYQTWQDVPTATISFSQIGDAPAGNGGYNWDGFNTVSTDLIVPDAKMGAGE